MLRIPGTLTNTTLGDVFGALHREQVSGVLEVVEANGRLHQVVWQSGYIVVSPTEAPSPACLDPLFRLGHARLRFRVMRSRATGVSLTPTEFLWGRPRTRDRRGGPPTGTQRMDLRSLGLPESASAQEVRARYRRLVRKYHPDLHSLASEHARQEAARRFRQITAAYGRLTVQHSSSHGR